LRFEEEIASMNSVENISPKGWFSSFARNIKLFNRLSYSFRNSSNFLVKDK
jgi:hypothetical protein